LRYDKDDSDSLFLMHAESEREINKTCMITSQKMKAIAPSCILSEFFLLSF